MMSCSSFLHCQLNHHRQEFVNNKFRKLGSPTAQMNSHAALKQWLKKYLCFFRERSSFAFLSVLCGWKNAFLLHLFCAARHVHYTPKYNAQNVECVDWFAGRCSDLRGVQGSATCSWWGKQAAKLHILCGQLVAWNQTKQTSDPELLFLLGRNPCGG